MKFTSEESRSRTEIEGVGITTITQVIKPGSVTRKQIESFVAKNAKENGDGYWVAEIPGLDVEVGDGIAEDTVDLEAEIASTLNGWGVSVSDWRAYCLD